jgi:hypothetical protein
VKGLRTELGHLTLRGFVAYGTAWAVGLVVAFYAVGFAFDLYHAVTNPALRADPRPTAPVCLAFRDGDGDGLICDGTAAERPLGPWHLGPNGEYVRGSGPKGNNFTY